jgi:CHAD domain-containing protein
MHVSNMRKSPQREGVFRKRVRAFSRDMERIHKGDVAALHRTRVASRRLRELLPLLGLDREEVSKIARRLRRLTRQLGIVRELDVLMLTVRELTAKRGYPTIALREVEAAVAAARSSARARLATKLPPSKLRRLVRRLERAVSQSQSTRERRAARGGVIGSKHPWLWALDARSIRRAAKLKSSLDATGALYLPEQLHQVRIALKKLRYTEELRAEARGRRNPDVATLKAAQDLLGRLHDREVLIGRAREVQSLLSASHLMAWHQMGLLVSALDEDCRRLHGKYIRRRAQLVAFAVRAAGTTAFSETRDRAAG